MSNSLISLGELMAEKIGTIEPKKFPEETFDLYSIPAFDSGSPEILPGASIGSAKQFVCSGDVLLSKIVPHIRRAWVVGPANGRRIIASGEWIVFRSDHVDPAYLKHVLLGDPFHAQFMQTVAGVGGSLLRARPAQVANIRIPLPSLAEQRRIAAILDQADVLKAKRREALAQLDHLAQAIFIDMFGDPVENQSGGEAARMDALCEVTSSKRVFADELVEQGVPFFRGTEIGQLGANEAVKPTLFVSSDHYERLKAEAGVPTRGDLLLPSICPDGRIYEVERDDPFYFKDARVLWIKANEARISSTYLKHYLRKR
ncbi:MAG: restriction endonuclease subunit S [Methyloversatilis discipulorum]|uniref:restriction endonuclease subunit S n=1 Tax=Methyloversatilis discipulorum TaxID=1119528 RepID=UPI0026EFCA75|nr:restriction endonuclease subunit S [Methyloversatilis discipulorum]MBT9516155.1 restriction endonuclease subunit S [Methyloversatilis discipulorum]